MARSESYTTKQKDTILEFIIHQTSEFTIKDVYDELKGKVGLTTIYRLVDKLVIDNKLKKFISANNITYYQYLEECDKDNHFYLKCTNCKKMIHVDCECIKNLSNHILKNHKFNLSNENIIISGVCDKCKK